MDGATRGDEGKDEQTAEPASRSPFEAQEGGSLPPRLSRLRRLRRPPRMRLMSSIASTSGRGIDLRQRRVVIDDIERCTRGLRGQRPGEGGRRRPKGSDEGESFPPSDAVQEETAKRAPMCLSSSDAVREETTQSAPMCLSSCSRGTMPSRTKQPVSEDRSQLPFRTRSGCDRSARPDRWSGQRPRRHRAPRIDRETC